MDKEVHLFKLIQCFYAWCISAGENTSAVLSEEGILHSLRLPCFPAFVVAGSMGC